MNKIRTNIISSVMALVLSLSISTPSLAGIDYSNQNPPNPLADRFVVVPIAVVAGAVAVYHWFTSWPSEDEDATDHEIGSFQKDNKELLEALKGDENPSKSGASADFDQRVNEKKHEIISIEKYIKNLTRKIENMGIVGVPENVDDRKKLNDELKETKERLQEEMNELGTIEQEIKKLNTELSESERYLERFERYSRPSNTEEENMFFELVTEFVPKK